MSLQSRIFLQWDEAAQMLGMDREGLRQALLYRWSPTRSEEKDEWLPVMLTLPGQEYMTTLQSDRGEPDIYWNGRDSYYKNCLPGGALNFSDGSSLPLCGGCEGASWDATHGYGGGWGHAFSIGGAKLVISPESVTRACGEDGYIGALGIAPMEWCTDGFPFDLFFLVVTCENSFYRSQPRNLFESAVFLRSDVERMLEVGKPSEVPKPLDERERATLLCIIGGLARHAKLDLTQPYKAGETVAAMLPAGVKLSPRTIGDHLKAVREALDSRTT